MSSYQIAGRTIGPGHPAYIIAEMSANHGGSLEHAIRVLQAAKDCGADAVKIQTYTADTMTIPCDNQWFRIGSDSLWANYNLHDLYKVAYTPWEWQPRLKQAADDMGITLFSTPFDETSVDFLEEMKVSAYKIASFEVPDLALLRKVAALGKPIIMSTGMADLAEIHEAVTTIHAQGNHQLALLKCTSAYPADPRDMNLRTIPHLADAFGVIAGLSDHTMGSAIPVAAVALGACIIEKHFCLSRNEGGPDSPFSMEPDDLRQLVRDVRNSEAALGKVNYGVFGKENDNRIFRRSLFIVEDVKAGELLTAKNVRCIRPGYGLAPKHLPEVLGRRAVKDVERGTPLSWDLLG
ncbi:pseudaminic acid synthase [bacterium]|nr:pseudaminic acid synthase [bacterium]